MSEWQPIETAPRDGTDILVWSEILEELGNQSFGKLHAIARCVGGCWDVSHTCYYSVEAVNPTHWMPLPTPPKEEL